jgi:hypothetical protein
VTLANFGKGVPLLQCPASPDSHSAVFNKGILDGSVGFVVTISHSFESLEVCEEETKDQGEGLGSPSNDRILGEK